MTTNQVLSEKLQVPKLKDEEKAVFMLLNAGKKEAGRDEPTCPETYKLAGQQNVTDPYDQHGSSQKTIANIVGAKPLVERGGRPKLDSEGRPVMIPEVKSLEFKRGFLTVTAENQAAFQYLMRRKDNLSNPFRNVMGGKGKKMIFKLAEDKKELQDALQTKEMQYTAQKLVRETTFANLQAMALKMNQSADNRLHISPDVMDNYSALKLEMIRKSETYPKFVINSSDDQASRVKVQIYQCLELGLLRFDQGSYFLLGKTYSEIHKPAPDKEPADSLVTFFMDDKKGREKYQDMAEALRKILEA